MGENISGWRERLVVVVGGWWRGMVVMMMIRGNKKKETYLRVFSREVFIAFYGLGFWLLSLQVIGVFVYFGRFLESSRGLNGDLLNGGKLHPFF
ncbi:transmembrane protein, putative [Medicago truncatula]|uniref:Transmembrane protein, putative n=1 Tax=Medicago truncatula TaxID=3880 RepID=A0A072UB08_MEDTR|nr:transmembrane protein, putative [Medicago truncatula]